MRESAKTTRNQLKVMRERSTRCCPRCAVSRGSFSERRSWSTRWSTWKAEGAHHFYWLPLSACSSDTATGFPMGLFMGKSLAPSPSQCPWQLICLMFPGTKTRSAFSKLLL